MFPIRRHFDEQVSNTFIVESFLSVGWGIKTLPNHKIQVKWKPLKKWNGKGPLPRNGYAISAKNRPLWGRGHLR
jgi:hypothetical protein